MSRCVNPGSARFEEALRSNYVDKSGLVAYTNSIIRTTGKYVCVSRPRRFGKTMAADMLCAYYGRGQRSDALFAGLSAASCPSFAEHLNRYDVIRLSVIEFIEGSDGMGDLLAYMAESIADDLAELYPGVRQPRRPTLPNLLGAYYQASGIPFVFVIDEWDCVFRERIFGPDDQSRYLDWLRDVLKDRDYVALAYMTGILPIKKYGKHSALNMFSEKSMVNALPVQDLTGFTDVDVAEVSARSTVPLDELRFWYDGYQVSGAHVYNPKSVMEAVANGACDTYWTMTESYEALARYVHMDLDGLRGRVLRLVAGERVEVDNSTFQNDMYSVSRADDVLSLLIHLGYLTYEGQTSESGVCWIPNREVRREFRACLNDRGWEQVATAIAESERLLAATLAGDEQAVADLLAAAHESVASALTYNSENSLACTIELAYYSARRSYRLVRELPAGVGFADIAFRPLPGAGMPGIIVELKYGDTADGALAQIRERGYVRGMDDVSGELVLVGVSYDRDDPNKPHACRIERV